MGFSRLLTVSILLSNLQRKIYPTILSLLYLNGLARLVQYVLLDQILQSYGRNSYQLTKTGMLAVLEKNLVQKVVLKGLAVQ